MDQTPAPAKLSAQAPGQTLTVQLIGATSTEKGLRIQAVLDPTDYPLKKKVSAAQLSEVRIPRETFHGEWNYSIAPHSKKVE